MFAFLLIVKVHELKLPRVPGQFLNSMEGVNNANDLMNLDHEKQKLPKQKTPPGSDNRYSRNKYVFAMVS